MKNYVEINLSIFTLVKGEIKTLITYEEDDNLPFLIRDKINECTNLDKVIWKLLKSRANITNAKIILNKAYSKTNKMDEERLIALSYIVITPDIFLSLQNEWISIDSIRDVFAFDYKEILEDSIKRFKEIIFERDNIKMLLKGGFTMPELQKLYESIEGKKYDRRNFHRKMINEGNVIETGTTRLFEGRKKAKVYQYQ